ncbi:MAG: GNAT family N-acetyltransferase [Prolixibacteraceae bacterium]|nr:GNAT family N-acetyltransferase [Prolixibacteraceae bacterium]
MNITLEKSTKENLPFIKTLFFEHKKEDLGMDNFPDEVVQQVLDIQFKAHEAYYPSGNGVEDQVIFADGQSIGRIILSVSEKNIHFSEMIILKGFQGKGIGGGIMHNIISRAKKEGKSVTFYVAKNHGAIGFYKRLGFKTIGENELDLEMKLVP